MVGIKSSGSGAAEEVDIWWFSVGFGGEIADFELT